MEYRSFAATHGLSHSSELHNFTEVLLLSSNFRQLPHPHLSHPPCVAVIHLRLTCEIVLFGCTAEEIFCLKVRNLMLPMSIDIIKPMVSKCERWWEKSFKPSNSQRVSLSHAYCSQVLSKLEI